MPQVDLGKVTGDTGATPVITATASVDANTGTPSVVVTQTGTAEAPTIDFAFHNLKGSGGGTVGMNGVTILCTVASANWSQTTDSDGYYTNSVSFGNHTIKPSYRPLIAICGSTFNTKETSAQAAAFNLCDIFNFADNDSVSSMTVKAKTKPTETFYVTVSGDGT